MSKTGLYKPIIICIENGMQSDILGGAIFFCRAKIISKGDPIDSDRVFCWGALTVIRRVQGETILGGSPTWEMGCWNAPNHMFPSISACPDKKSARKAPPKKQNTEMARISTLHSALCTPNSILRTSHSTLHTCDWHSALHTLHCALFTPHSTLFTLKHTLATKNCPIHTPRFTLQSLHSTLHILHFTLHILHFTLHIPHCTFTFHSPHAPQLQTRKRPKYCACQEKWCPTHAGSSPNAASATQKNTLNSHDVPHLPRNLHVAATWRSPDNLIRHKHKTRHVFKALRLPQKKIKSSSEDLAQVYCIRCHTMSYVTTFNTISETWECYEVPRHATPACKRHYDLFRNREWEVLQLLQ